SFADLSNAYLDRSLLRSANLHGTWLCGAILVQADLACADLSGSRLLVADFTDANLDGANLAGAEYDESTRWPNGFDPELAGACGINSVFLPVFVIYQAYGGGALGSMSSFRDKLSDQKTVSALRKAGGEEGRKVSLQKGVDRQRRDGSEPFEAAV